MKGGGQAPSKGRPVGIFKLTSKRNPPRGFKPRKPSLDPPLHGMYSVFHNYVDLSREFDNRVSISPWLTPWQGWGTNRPVANVRGLDLPGWDSNTRIDFFS